MWFLLNFVKFFKNQNITLWLSASYKSNYKRAYSIRTRIKTRLSAEKRHSFNGIREHIPLEQGLRPFIKRSARSCFERIREHIPLEQGLRPRGWMTDPSCNSLIREHIPLEQGLRHPRSKPHSQKSIHKRAYSIRTRIKTIMLQ